MLHLQPQPSSFFTDAPLPSPTPAEFAQYKAEALSDCIKATLQKRLIVSTIRVTHRSKPLYDSVTRGICRPV